MITPPFSIWARPDLTPKDATVVLLPACEARGGGNEGGAGEEPTPWSVVAEETGVEVI